MEKYLYEKKYLFVVSHKNIAKSEFELDDESFKAIKAFSRYSKAHMYIKIKLNGGIYRRTDGTYCNKDGTLFYKIEKVSFD